MDNQKELTPEEKAALEKTTKETAKRKEIAKKLAEKYKVDVLYGNSKGEFFTQKSLALNSEGGNKDKVTTYKFDE
jgi:hypothetical protein